MNKLTNGNTIGWHVGTEKKCDNLDECPRIKALDVPQIRITYPVWQALRKLCQDVQLEWQALLTGVKEGQDVHVTGYYIPKQTVTASTVTNDDCIDEAFINERSIVCGVHSHGDMGVFFSHVDDTTNRTSRITHHIVINNKAEHEAVARITLACGGEALVEAKVIITDIPDVDVVGKDNITVKKYEPVQWYNSKDKWDGHFPGHNDTSYCESAGMLEYDSDFLGMVGLQVKAEEFLTGTHRVMNKKRKAARVKALSGLEVDYGNE